MPKKVPGIGEDVSHLFGGGGTAIGDDVSHLFADSSSLPTRPVSPEDFTGPEQSASDYAWSAAKAIPGIVAGGVKGAARLAYDATIDPILHPLRDPNAMPLRQDMKDIASSQLAQFGKAGQDIEQGRYSEAVGHTAAGVLPLAGPAAAQAGEKIGAGDPTGAAEATALLLPSIAPRVGRVVAPKLASIGEQIAAKGGKAVKAAAPYAVPLAVDAALHYAGVGPVATIAKIIAKAAAKGEMIAPEAVPLPKPHGAPIRVLEPTTPPAVSTSRIPYRGVEDVPPPAAPLPIGTRLVKEPVGPTVEDVMSGRLSDLQRPVQPARITTPPAPDLPPGYTPRTTVPKDVPKRMAKVAAPEPASAPTPPKRAYFLRSPEEVAAIQARKAAAAAPEAIVPSDITDPSQMPEAWRSRMGPPEFPKPRKPTSHVTKAQVDDLAKGSTDSGLTAREAIRRISKDSSMSAETRVRLMTALGKLAKGSTSAAVESVPAEVAKAMKRTTAKATGKVKIAQNVTANEPTQGTTYTGRVSHVTKTEHVPSILEHGFDVNRQGRGLGGDHYGPGVYASDQGGDAVGFWRDQLATMNESGRVPTTVLRGQANLKNALIVDDMKPIGRGMYEGYSSQEIVAKHLPKYLDDFNALIKKGVRPNQALGQIARKAGHDGLVFQRRAGDEVVAFHPEGVKFDKPIED